MFIDIQKISGGLPLPGGMVYIGLSTDNPVDTPASVYTDAECTTPISTPVLLNFNGLPVDSTGAQVNLYTNFDFSVQLQDKYGANFYLVAPVFSVAEYSTIGDSITFSLAGGKSFIVSDDLTLVSATKLLGIFDDVIAANAIYSYFVFDSGDDTVGSYWVYDKVDFNSSYIVRCKNALGEALDTLSVSALGVSLKSITADKIQLTGVQQHVGYKSGTLASPPVGMVIGEVWVDTTDSAVHPVYRVSTVAT